MKKKYYLIAIFLTILIILGSKSVLSVLPPSITIYCHVKSTGESSFINLFPVGNLYGKYIYYNETINDNQNFSSLNNFCEEDVTPIINFLKQRSINYYQCDFNIYSKTKEDASKNLGYYTEKIDNWLMTCNNLDFIPNSLPILASLLIIGFIILIPIAIIALIIIFIIKLKKKGKYNVRKHS